MTAILALLAVLAGPAPEFPRIANLWGCSGASIEYDRWARYDLLVLGGGGIDELRRFASEVRRRNPAIRLLGTAPLMNLGSPEQTPWLRDEWFLRRPDGTIIRWWADQIHTPNLLLPECLDALVARSIAEHGAALDERTLDGLFFDSVVGAATWLGEVDTDRDGRADAAADVNPRWQAAQNRLFDRLRERFPGLLILANDVDAGHRSHLHGRLFEGAPLLDRVVRGALGAGEAIRELQAWTTESLQPPLTFAIMTHPVGWQGWRVGRGDKVTTPGELDRVARDFARMRLGLLLALMSDAHYAYDVGTVWYGSPLWYAEYDAPLGAALGPARTIDGVPPRPILEWRAGQPTDAFTPQEGAVAEPAGLLADVADATSGWRCLIATDPRRVPLIPGRGYRVAAELAIERPPTGTIQFNVRTALGGWERHDKAVIQHYAAGGERWTIDATFTPDDFADYSAQWHMHGAGRFRLERLLIEELDQRYLRRDFAGGVALLNPLAQAIAVPLERPARRLRDEREPRYIVECDDQDAGFTADGAWERVDGEGRWVGRGHRRARKPGAVAQWSLPAPSSDAYTVYVSLPDDQAATEAVEYTCAGRRAVLDQRGGDGGWRELLRVDLTAGQAVAVRLISGGGGATLADAVRLESAARRHDGARVERVELGPLEGAVLIWDGG